MEQNFDINKNHNIINEFLQTKIAAQEQIVERKKEEARGSEKKEKKGFFKKILDGKPSSQLAEEKLGDYRALNSLLSIIYIYHSEVYNLSSELKESLDSVCQFLDPEEIKRIKNSVNDSIRAKEGKKLATLKEKCAEFKKLAEKSKVASIDIYSATYHENAGKFNSIFSSMESAILREISSERYYFLDSKKDKNYEDDFIKNVESLINSKYFDLKLDKNKKIKDNFPEIKKVYLETRKIDKLINSLNSCMQILNTDNIVDFKEVVDLLQKIKDKNLKLLNDKNKYLEKFDLNSLQGDINKKYEEETEAFNKEQGILSYQSLYYDLCKAKDKEPDNYEKIREIESKLLECSRSFSLQNSEISTAQIAAREKYNNEIISKKAIADVNKERIETEHQLKADAYQRLRKMAIEELKLTGALDSIDPTIKNGDISNAAEIEAQEAMISDKMEEIARISETTPQERFLYDMKQHNTMPEAATVNDLTPQQRIDSNNFYRDSSFSFVKEYKNSVIGEAKENLFSKYLKYKASLVDKNKGLSFSEFVKVNYSLAEEQKIEMESEIEGRKR